MAELHPRAWVDPALPAPVPCNPPRTGCLKGYLFLPRITCSRLISLPLTWPEIDSSDRGQALCGMAGPDWPGVKWGPAQAYCPVFLVSPLPLSASGLSGVHLSVSLSFFSSFCFWLSQLPLCYQFCIFLTLYSFSLLDFFCLSTAFSVTLSVSHIFFLCHPPLPSAP